MQPEYNLLIKMRIMGDSGVGKSCLLRRFADGEYDESYISTIGVDFKIKNIEADGKIYKLQIWDAAGQERFREIRSQYYRGCQATVIAFDTTDESSFSNVRNLVEEARKDSTESHTLVLVGTKCDLVYKRVVDNEEAQTLADELGIKYIETSAKKDISVEKAFRMATGEVLKKFGRTTQLADQTMKRSSKSPIPRTQPREVLIEKLDKYINRVQSHKKSHSDNINFKYGFWVLKDSRAVNRKINYLLALKLKEELDEGIISLATIFDEDHLSDLRKNIIHDNRLGSDPYFINRGINSKELNSVIKGARKAFAISTQNENEKTPLVKR